MKRKYMDGRDWTFMASLKSDIRPVSGNYEGWVAVVTETKVAYSLSVDYEDNSSKTVFDDDYTCIAYLPKEDYWCISAVYDTQGVIVEWYIDILAGQGMTEDGIPFYDDLYLDVIVRPDYGVVLIDEDDLKEAIKKGDIDQEAYDFAYEVAHRVKETVAKDHDLLTNYLDWRHWINK